jgi:hypothetical protein
MRKPAITGAIALLLVALVVLLGAPTVAAAPTCTTDCYVSPTGNDGNDGATAATPLLTIQLAVNTVTPGGTVHLAAGTYNQDTALNKSLTLDGAGPATTFIDALSIGLDISAGNVTVKNLAVINSSIHGARIQAGTAVNNITFDTVHFTTNASRGLEIATAANQVTVTDCIFDGNTTGIRMASNAVVDGLDIFDSTFRNHTNTGSGIGFYQASDGNPGNIRDLHVNNSTFTNNGFAGIYGEEMRDVTIENSTFTNTARGFLLFEAYTASGTPSGNIVIQDNDLTDNSAAAVQVVVQSNALANPVTIQGNTFTQDVAVPAANWAQIDIRLQTGYTHAAINVLDNDITFNGSFTGAATAVYAVKMRGAVDVIEIHDNTLDGGMVGTDGGVPPTSGIYVVSNVAGFGAVEATAQIDVTGNEINGFVNGVTVYNEVAAADGGLPAGATLNVTRNDLADNSAFGIRSGAGEATYAVCNWWGAANGPGPVGPGSGSNVTSDVIFAPWLVTDDLNGPCLGDVYVSTTAAGTVGALAYGPHDILHWDGSAWSKWFDGTAAGLMPSGRAIHNINAVWIPDTSSDDAVFSFVQNARVVDGVPGKVNGMDLVWWDGAGFSLWFDGEDVGLTNKTKEKIDALHVLDGSLSPIGSGCLAYLLISTQGDGRVPAYGGGQLKFDGTDVLGFCMTNSGANTAGFWHRVLNGKAEGMPGQALTSLSASDDGQVLYLTTKGAFNVDDAHGGHSMVYQYDFATGEFSGPFFSAPAQGLTRQVDALQVEALP